MAVQNNFAPGVDGLTYKPNTYAELGDMIGKIAYQVIRQVEAKNPLAVFDKMPVNKGDTIEQAVIKLVEAEAYDESGANALARSTKKKMSERETELRQEFEAKQKEQEERHIRDMRALLSGHKEEQIDKSEDEEEKTYEQSLLEKITQKFIK